MVSVSPTTFHHCPECGLQLSQPTQTGGLCPRCLIATAVEHLSTIDHPALGRFGAVGASPDIAKLNQQLPAYEFVELLGRGGAGWVFRARQRSLNRPVAIKILHGSPSTLTDAVQRFTREAQILARLNHPRIVTIHDFGSLADSQYIVMEYVPGPTLRELLRGPALGRNAVRIAGHICDAVAHAHSMSVMHRDLKPENVLFDSFDNLDSLKVADFGISRLIGDTEPGFHQTQTGFVVGTPFYAAPEQMVPEGPVDARADIYSIGVMLYEMLAGQLPRGRFSPPSHHRRTLPGLDAVVLRCLESDPARRYPDVASLRTALGDVVSGAARRRRLLKFALVPIAVAILAAFAWLATANRDVQEAAQPSAQASQRTQPNLPAQAAPLTRPDKTKVATLPPSPDAPEKSTAPPALAKSDPVSPEPAQTEQFPKQLPRPEKPGEAPTPPPASRDEDYFQVSSVRVYGFTPASLEFRIKGEQRDDNLKLREGASLVWVVQTNGVHRIDTPFKMDAHSSAVSIAERVMLGFNDAWPLEVFIAERWYTPTTGTRRLSNIIRVNTADIRAEPPPRLP